MAGGMKLFSPEHGDAFAAQLEAAELPMQNLSRTIVPLVEIALGSLLLRGLFARVAALGSIVIMCVATYVHLKADDPSLYPSQPVEPYIPLVAIALSLYVLWRGAGAWSADLKKSR